MNKIKAFVLCTVYASIFGAAGPQVPSSLEEVRQKLVAVKKPQKWLILGAGTKGDAPGWNRFFAGSNVSWDGFNIKAECYAANCIAGDFNDVASLQEQLKDDDYDVILFDKATVYFSNWSKEHLEVLKKKLKDGGSLYIEFSPGRSGERMYPLTDTGAFDRFDDLYRLAKDDLIAEYKKSYRELMKKGVDGVLLNALGQLGLDGDKGPLFGRISNLLYHPHNITLLKEIFGSADFFYDGFHPSYDGDASKGPYYHAVKGSGASIPKRVMIVGSVEDDGSSKKIIQKIMPPKGFNKGSSRLYKLYFFDKDGKGYAVLSVGALNKVGEILGLINAALGTSYQQLYSHKKGAYLDNDASMFELKNLSHEEVFGLDGKHRPQDFQAHQVDFEGIETVSPNLDDIASVGITTLKGRYELISLPKPVEITEKESGEVYTLRGKIDLKSGGDCVWLYLFDENKNVIAIRFGVDSDMVGGLMPLLVSLFSSEHGDAFAVDEGSSLYFFFAEDDVEEILPRDTFDGFAQGDKYAYIGVDAYQVPVGLFEDSNVNMDDVQEIAFKELQ